MSLAAERLTALAEVVADGQALDWAAAALSAETPAERVVITAFRDLALVGGLFATATAAPPLPRRARARLSPGACWGSLRIKAHVGRGRFGDVYRAWDSALDRDVALKLIDDDRGASPSGGDVISEGRLMARVRHPNVVAIHGAQRIADIIGLSMEFVDGSTLEEELSSRGPFSADELIGIGVQICDALAAVHAAGLVHRDVKASNILRHRASGRLMLGDFGTGRDLEETGVADGLVGTPAYLAPEVFGGRPATHQSDVYSVGVLLFRLATGEYPFRERSIRALQASHARGERASVRDRAVRLPDPLIAIIDRALEPDPSGRFESAGAMAQALRYEQRRPARRRALMWTTAGAFVFLALVAGVGRALWRTAAPLNLAERDSILVATFDNRTTESILDGAIEQALELELADSGFVTVASRERIVETLALMRRGPETVVDWPIGREIALRDGRIRVVIAGQVDRFGREYRISARLFEPERGHVVGSVVDTAGSIDDLMRTISRMARDVRQRLGEVLPALPEPAGDLPKVRTNSISALKKYAAALPDLYPNANPNLARQLLEEAIREDPEFALAHLMLARAIRAGYRPPASESIDRAILIHLDRAAELVSATGGIDVHIVAAEAENLRAFLARDEETQRDARRSHRERALQAAQMWQRLQPTSERAIQLQLELQGGLGRPASADMPLVRRLVELRPNALDALNRAGQRAVAAGEFAEAREYLARGRALLDVPIPGRNDRDPAITTLAGLFEDAWVRNDVAEARQWLRRIDAMRAEVPNPTVAYFDRAVWCYVALGQFARAEAIAAQIRHQYYRPYFTLVVAKRRGDANRRADAHVLQQAAAQLFPDRSVLNPANYWGIRFAVALAERNFTAARREIEGRVRAGDPPDWTQEMEADLALRQGQAERAIALLQPLVAGDDSTLLSGGWVKRSAWLAEAFVAAGQSDQAIRVLENVSSRKREITYPSCANAPDWLSGRDQLAQLYRQAGRAGEAEPIEAELRILLSAADADHPIVRRLASSKTSGVAPSASRR